MNISGLDKAEVLAALYNHSKQQSQLLMGGKRMKLSELEVGAKDYTQLGHHVLAVLCRRIEGWSVSFAYLPSIVAIAASSEGTGRLNGPTDRLQNREPCPDCEGKGQHAFNLNVKHP